MTDDELDAIRERRLAELEESIADTELPDAPVVVESEEHFEELVGTHRLALIDFHAEWCGPCHMLTPILESMAGEVPATIVKLDIDRHQGLAGSHGVRSVPTMILYADGEPAERLVGVRDRSTLEALIDQYAE